MTTKTNTVEEDDDDNNFGMSDDDIFNLIFLFIVHYNYTDN